MPLLHRPLVAVAALAVGAFTAGCSHEHGPLSDKPNTTSLGTAGRFPASMISTSTGIAWRPSNPQTVIPGTIQGETSPFTTQVRPMVTLFGTAESWVYGQSYTPVTGWAMRTWTSGPNLPVEPWNMALEVPPGEGGGEGHSAPKGHHPKL